jgi:hypothetical protein
MFTLGEDVEEVKGLEWAKAVEKEIEEVHSRKKGFK